MRVIVAGSRTIEEYTIVEAAIEASGFDITEVVSGGQVSVDPKTRKRYGADYFGEMWARQNGVPVKRFPAKWSDLSHPDAIVKTNRSGHKYDVRAGFRRNEEMAEYAHTLIAVRRNKSPGTTNMIELAQARGLVVFIWEVEEHSYWLADGTGYVTPAGEFVRLWNGPQLHGHRNSAQQQAQREIRTKEAK